MVINNIFSFKSPTYLFKVGFFCEKNMNIYSKKNIINIGVNYNFVIFHLLELMLVT